jgi:hypothetical protein
MRRGLRLHSVQPREALLQLAKLIPHHGTVSLVNMRAAQIVLLSNASERVAQRQHE